jgi:hypothetical protein
MYHLRMDASVPKSSYAVLLRAWAPFVVLLITCLAVFGLSVVTERLSAGWWGIGPGLFALGILVGALVLLGVLTGYVWPSLLCMLLAAFAFAFGDNLAYLRRVEALEHGRGHHPGRARRDFHHLLLDHRPAVRIRSGDNRPRRLVSPVRARKHTLDIDFRLPLTLPTRSGFGM